MGVLEWICCYPLVVDKGVCIASAMSLSAQALAFDIMGRNAIQADFAWADATLLRLGRLNLGSDRVLIRIARE